MKPYTYCPICRESLVIRPIDGKERHVCPVEGCEYVFWDNPIPVVAAIIEFQDKVLLVRNKGWPRNMFGLVTGFLEKGETTQAGIQREVKEELALQSQIVEMVGLYNFLEMNQLIIAYHVRAEGKIEKSDELEEVKLVNIEKLKPWPFGTGLAVEDWLSSRRSPSPY